jgi:UvrD-like helicase family protein
MTKLYKYVGFDDHLLALGRKGGKFSKAANSVYALLGKAGSHDDPFETLKVTNYGESRIDKCVKYDLTGAARLVTVRQSSIVILLYVGDHEDCDKWLDRNKGRTFAMNESNQIESTIVGISDPEVQPGKSPLSSPGPLLNRLEAALVDRLLEGLTFTLGQAINGLSAASSSADVEEVTVQIQDPIQRDAVRDTLLLLLTGSLSEAEVRGNLYVEDVTGLQEFAEFEIPDIVDSEFVKSIDSEHPRYGEVLRQFAKSSDYKSWMTFLHPDQDVITKQVFSGAAKLLGVSGSGKTCVVVRRAVELAQRYPNGQILVLTLNEPLANLVDSLIDTCALPEERSRIDVKALYEICRNLLLEFEPQKERHYRSVTWKGEEHIDEIWLEYYQCEANNHDAEVLSPVHDSLIAQGYRADRYLRDEMDWVRSACGPYDRDQYVRMQRKGRVVPLGEESRARILTGLEGWERKMSFVGGSDVLDVASALLGFRDQIEPRYRCVLVDECQDFGNVELSIVRSLAPAAEDDLFLCGDAAQQVSSRYQNLREAGIDVPSARSKKLTRNYRNSKDILRAAHEVLTKNITEEMLEREDFEVLDPDYSVFEGNLPVLLSVPEPADEPRFALTYAKTFTDENDGSKACIALAGYSLYEIENWAKALDLPVLDGKQDLDTGSIFLSDLEQTKGFEFDLMCILNCRNEQIPKRGDPESESFRDLSRLYVAMTRAKFELILSYCAEPSTFFDGIEEYVGIGEWSDYVDEADLDFPGVDMPLVLENMREEGLSTINIGDMTGPQFLYSSEAVGLSSDLIGRIRALVDGIGLRRGLDVVKWRTMADASRDFRESPVSRQQWGPVVGKKFSELTLKLGL